ncbi:hypothetical protein Trydic_g2869 [Trypoxylus dichotomus]
MPLRKAYELTPYPVSINTVPAPSLDNPQRVRRHAVSFRTNSVKYVDAYPRSNACTGYVGIISAATVSFRTHGRFAGRPVWKATTFPSKLARLVLS